MGGKISSEDIAKMKTIVSNIKQPTKQTSEVKDRVRELEEKRRSEQMKEVSEVQDEDQNEVQDEVQKEDQEKEDARSFKKPMVNFALTLQGRAVIPTTVGSNL